MPKQPITLELRTLNYIKPDETEPTKRTVITAQKPATTLTCLDVTELDAEAAETVRKNFEAYQQAFEAHQKAFPNFENYLKELKIEVPIKWRSFALNRILPEVPNV